MAPPILEFDPDPDALIHPRRQVAARDLPEHAVPCFFADVIAGLAARPDAKVHHELSAEHGAWPVFEIDVDGRGLVVFHPEVGAPLAAGFLEEVIALGCRRFVACGGAGAVAPGLTVGALVVPTSAVRDEGTSYHYAPPDAVLGPSPAALAAVTAALEAAGTPFVTGPTWTTDGFYRETAAKVARRRAAGCLTVEMETAAFFAVAAFRGVEFAQILYAGDDLSGPEWADRGWRSRLDLREALFWLAADACLRL